MRLMRLLIGASALLLTAAGCTSVEEAQPAAAGHFHDDAVYPETPAEPALPLKNAEYPGARFRQARFYTAGRRSAIDRIIIHTTEGRYEGAISWFRDPANPYRTSAHYVIRSADGEITQMVREGDTAHHERNNNARSIGIEHEAFIAQPRWYTLAMYRSSASLVRYLCRKYNIPMDRQHILAHSETDPSRRDDPGPHWDWDLFMQMVRDGADPAPVANAAAPAPDDGEACRTQYWNCNFSRTGRERCEGGRIVERQDCPAGCDVMPVGRDDLCRPEAQSGENFGACNAQGQPGTCMDAGQCAGTPVPGFCPGGNHIQCCTRVAEPAPAPAPPPAEAPSVNGLACQVDGAAGQCVELSSPGLCRAPAGLVYTVACGDRGACCVELRNDPPPPADPPPASPPPAAPPANNGSTAGDPCDVYGTVGVCLTPADAANRCNAANNEVYRHPTCGDETLCCITIPRAIPVNDEFANAPECNIGGEVGLCVATGTCRADGGYSTPGYCPGGNDIQCCRW